LVHLNLTAKAVRIRKQATAASMCKTVK